MSNAICSTNKEVPQEMLLGNLLFMNLTDMKIPVDDLLTIFSTHNIPQSYIRRISPVDAYRRATSELKGKTISWENETTGALEDCKIEVDEIKCDVDMVKRIVGIKRIDEVAEDVSYTPVAEFNFNRTTQTISWVALFTYTVGWGPSHNYEEIQNLFLRCKGNFDDWSTYHNKVTIRNIVNRIVADTHPINLMPTGLCKFTPANHTEMLYALKEALHEMNNYDIKPGGGKNIVEIIPVVDTEEQRFSVEQNYTGEVKDEMARLVLELRNVLNTKTTINSRTAASYIERFKFLKEKADDYDALLGVYTQSLQTQIMEAIKLVNDNTETK